MSRASQNASSSLAAPRMERWRGLPLFFALQRQARDHRRRQRRRPPGRRSFWRRRALEFNVYAADPSRGDAVAGKRCIGAQRPYRSRATGSRTICRGAAIAVGAFDDECAAGRFRRGGARRRRSGQRRRPAGLLRLPVRRHRQPLAAGGRHFDRRRRAGFRAGDPRQARGLAAAGISRAGPRPRGAGAHAVKASGLSFAGRRRFWQLFTAHAVAHPERAPSEPISSASSARREATGRRGRDTARSRWSAPARAIRNC